MGLEVGDYIDNLNPLWPLGTDPKSEGDNHFRLLKTALGNAVTGDATITRLRVNDENRLTVDALGVLVLNTDAADLPVFEMRVDGSPAVRLEAAAGAEAPVVLSGYVAGSPVEVFRADPSAGISLNYAGLKGIQLLADGFDIQSTVPGDVRVFFRDSTA
ncbi:MAG: hypothetical protein ACC642_00005, partial [Pseudomonadales bacterium]